MIEDSELVTSLLQQGLIDQPTLKLGLERTKQSGTPLYDVLISERLIAEDQLVGLLASLLNVNVMHVNVSSIPIDVRRLVPASLARRNRVIPIECRDGELVLGMVDPIDVLAMDEVATHIGIDIRPVLVGPTEMDEAIESLYGGGGTESIDLSRDVIASFDDFDVAGMVDEVLAGDEWSEMFEETGEPTAQDSEVLSREMRDRPSTDVLGEDLVDDAVQESDDPADYEILEDLGQPKTVPRPFDQLAGWEVDGALEGGPDSSAQILTFESAEEFFRGAPGEEVPAILEIDVEDDTGIEDPGPLSDILAQAGHDSMAPVGESENIQAEPDDTTGRTSLGVGPFTGPESQTDLPSAASEAQVSDGAGPDYGALGRTILSDGTDSGPKPDSGSTTQEVDVAPRRKANLDTREMEPEDLEEWAARSEDRSAVSSTDVLGEEAAGQGEAANLLPAGVDTEALAVALTNLLVAKGILTVEEVVELARSLKG